MQQTAIRFDTASTIAAPQPGDQAAFQIGWDHARHALVPPAALMSASPALSQGWQAAQSVFGRRTWPARLSLRRWLALRLQAWRSGEAFDLEQLTPHHLAQIATARCPVRRVALHGAAGGPDAADAAVFVRLNECAAWAAGHVVMLSHAAAEAMRGVDADGARRRARACESAGETDTGLDAAAWWRVAALRGFASPRQQLPFASAATLPLAALPPNRVRVLSPAQGLQALLTQAFAAQGWAQRCGLIAERLPAHTLRHDFHLFVGAMAPRVLAAPASGAALRNALEDAWLDERVQRRWQHLALSLGEAGTEALLDAIAALPLPGRHVLQHAAAQATEAWQLPVLPALPAATAPAAPTAPSAAAAARSALGRVSKRSPRVRRADLSAATMPAMPRPHLAPLAQ